MLGQPVTTGTPPADLIVGVALVGLSRLQRQLLKGRSVREARDPSEPDSATRGPTPSTVAASRQIGDRCRRTIRRTAQDRSAALSFSSSGCRWNSVSIEAPKATRP